MRLEEIPKAAEPSDNPDVATLQDLWYCYRLLLGREPDPEGWATHSRAVQGGTSVRVLAETFFRSPEFRKLGLVSSVDGPRAASPGPEPRRGGVAGLVREVSRRLSDTLRSSLPVRAPPAGVEAFLGLRPDQGYANRRERERKQCLESLAGCAPEGANPREMEGYLHESALRFHDTLGLIRAALGGSTAKEARLLEIGSSPFLLTILLREQLPSLYLMGVNYFGSDEGGGQVHSGGVHDPRGRLREAQFLSADVERHDLASLGEFDVCLFCEVIEHLPYDPAWALFNIARRLKPGGSLILTTPNPARMENIRRLALHNGSNNDPISGYGIHGRHNREYNAQELEDLLAGTGLRIAEKRTIDVFPTAHSRSAEEKGYGAYHVIRAVLESSAQLHRPEWLYRSFPPGALANERSLASG